MVELQDPFDPEVEDMSGDEPLPEQGAEDATTPPRSVEKLLVAVVLSMLAAAVIVVVFVMPAEYGVDPTGIGKLTGLTSLKADAQPKGHGGSQQDASVQPLTQPMTQLQTNQGSITLQPGESTEVKAEMVASQGFVYSWKTDGGVVDYDMHSKDESYSQGYGQASDQGVFVAPTEGLFGWWWENKGQAPVTITLTTNGFYNRLVRTQPQ
jgi:hypothetical protein